MESFEYDIYGRLVKQTSFEGVVTTYRYDAYGRLESKKFFDNQDILVETWGYVYDQFGRVAEINQNGRVTKTTCDAEGRTAKIETPEGILAYTYDKYGRQASVQTDNDPPTYYTYDRFGRLATVAADSSTTYYEYDVYGNLAKTKIRTGSESLVAVYQYDNMNRLVKLSNFVDKNNDGVFNSGDKNVSEFEYTLDNTGRKLHADERFWAELGKQSNHVDWLYDEMGRLVRENFDHYDDEFDQASEWIYDLVGNRLQQTVNGKITTYGYDENDRLLHEIFGEKETLYGYDHTQQTSKKVSENGVLVSETTFVYDAQGRMAVVTIVTATGVKKTSYEYDANGIRVAAVHEKDGVVTRTEYLNDPLSITGYSQVLKQTETVDGVVTKTISYVIGHQRISQFVVEGNTEQECYFTFDGHGSTRVLLDFVAGLQQIYSFDAYGNALGFDPSQAKTEFLYSGEQFDAKIGQQYLRARYYDPTSGRFNTQDPFFGNTDDPQSLHKYLYCHADPVNGIDPSGNTVYFAVRKINGAINEALRWIASGTIGILKLTKILWHGYIYIEDEYDNVTTFSWHPNVFPGMMANIFYGDHEYPGRVWKNDPRDRAFSNILNPDGSRSIIRYEITRSHFKEQQLISYIENVWIPDNKVGLEIGMDIANHGSVASYPSSEAASTYSLYKNNCFWWANEMLVKADITIPTSMRQELVKYNFGVGIDGDAVQEYLYARSLMYAGLTTLAVTAGSAALTVGSVYLAASLATCITCLTIGI